MSVILVLVAFSVILAVVFLFAFFWSVRNGQYDDTFGSSVRILFEDEKPVRAADDEKITTSTTTEAQSPKQ